MKTTQDGPMEGISELNMVIWRENQAKSPTVQFVHQDSLLCGRFFVHQKLKEIAAFDSPSSNMQSKNTILHIFCRIP